MVSRTEQTFAPPIPEARRWLDGVTFAPDRPLINLSQAAPAEAPPGPMLEAMAGMLGEASSHLYGAVLGNDDLRAALARNWGQHYGGEVRAAQVGITSGCNQAFAAVISALCTQGDEVILPVPWYFNHKMWLDMSGVCAVPLAIGPDMVPDPGTARGLITSRTKAIALVSPNNPCGVEYPGSVLQEFAELARAEGLALIVDETYRDFDSRDGAPHKMLQQAGWDDGLIQLYSFSKAYRLTGHRVGAIIGAPALLREIEKFIDTVAICPPQIGQRAALWGLENLADWLEGERQDVLARRRVIADRMPELEQKGWKLRGLGAYFAYLEHPFEQPAEQLAPKLVRDAGLLLLPATMFTPEGDQTGSRAFRMAFANADQAQLHEVMDRLAGFHPG